MSKKLVPRGPLYDLLRQAEEKDASNLQKQAAVDDILTARKMGSTATDADRIVAYDPAGAHTVTRFIVGTLPRLRQ